MTKLAIALLALAAIAMFRKSWNEAKVGTMLPAVFNEDDWLSEGPWA